MSSSWTRGESRFVWAAGALLTVVYAAWVHPYLHLPDGIGHDFGGTLPAWLEGAYWFRANGLFPPPWFSPGFCGGMANYPDPQSGYYSVPQWIAFVLDPLRTAWVSTVLSAGLGYVGMVLLLRDGFRRSPAAALFAGAAFLFNGFLFRRLISGEFGFHVYGLVPLTAWLLLAAEPRRIGPWREGGTVAAIAAMITYWLFGGFATLMVPGALAIVALAGVLPAPLEALVRMVRRGVPAAILAVACCAAKLNATASLMRTFPRADYQLPGFESPFVAAWFYGRSLFWPSQVVAAEASPLLANKTWAVHPHEWAYGVTVVPLLLLVAGIGLSALAASRGRVPRPTAGQALGGLVTAAVLAFPIALTTYTPEWNAVLKFLPLVGQTSFPFRWAIVAIPTVAAVSALVIDHPLVAARVRVPLAAIAAALVAALQMVEPDSYYRAYEGSAFYNPSPVVEAWYRPAPPIEAIVNYKATVKDLEQFYGPNDYIARGWSAEDCYAPIFGYRLEHLPMGDLHPGSPYELTDGHFNMKNPACYVYPEENGCAPGDHFREGQQAALEAFLNYRPFEFQKSRRQEIAEVVSGLCLLMVGVGVGVGVGRTGTADPARTPA